MSRLVARILLSIFTFPLGVALYWMAAAIAEQAMRGTGRRQEDYLFLTADAVTWAGVATYWCLLWRSSIPWTPLRVRGTAAAAAGAAIVAGGVGVAIGLAFGDRSDLPSVALGIGGPLAILLWLFATILLWRETAAERAARVAGAGSSAVACPTCGYNLTGLGEARCPECGSRFTLDELLAAQPARGVAADLG